MGKIFDSWYVGMARWLSEHTAFDPAAPIVKQVLQMAWQAGLACGSEKNIGPPQNYIEIQIFIADKIYKTKQVMPEKLAQMPKDEWAEEVHDSFARCLLDLREALDNDLNKINLNYHTPPSHSGPQRE